MSSNGVNFLRPRTTLHNLKLSPQNSFVESHTYRPEKCEVLRELLGQLMPAERYLFIPFLRTISQMGQTNHRSNEKAHKKTTGLI